MEYLLAFFLFGSYSDPAIPSATQFSLTGSLSALVALGNFEILLFAVMTC
jgi:hypothetical protein